MYKLSFHPMNALCCIELRLNSYSKWHTDTSGKNWKRKVSLQTKQKEVLVYHPFMTLLLWQSNNTGLSFCMLSKIKTDFRMYKTVLWKNKLWEGHPCAGCFLKIDLVLFLVEWMTFMSKPNRAFYYSLEKRYKGKLTFGKNTKHLGITKAKTHHLSIYLCP